MKRRNVLITGASSGIGKACAYRFAESDCNLFLVSRNIDELEKIKSELETEFQASVRIYQCDVRFRNHIEEVLHKILSEADIDVLINNAGLALGYEKVYEGDVEDWDAMIDTNVKGLLYVTRKVVKNMAEKNIPSHVVNIGSIAGVAAYPNGAVYCASKAAVKMISDGLRLDTVDKPIKVTNIEPGMVETNFSVTRFHGDAERAGNVYKGIEPLSADDIADCVIFAVEAPAHVQINEIVVTPLHQASATVVHRKK